MRQPRIIYYEPQVLLTIYYTQIYNEYKRENKYKKIADFFSSSHIIYHKVREHQSQVNQTV